MTIGSFEQKAKVEQEAAAAEVWPKRYRNHKGDVASASNAREASQLAGRGFTELHDYEHQEFPKMLHATGGKTMIVLNQEQEAAAIAKGYSLSPNQAAAEAAAVPMQAVTTEAVSEAIAPGVAGAAGEALAAPSVDETPASTEI